MNSVGEIDQKQYADARNTQSVDKNEVFKVGQNPSPQPRMHQICEKQKNSNLTISATSVKARKE